MLAPWNAIKSKKFHPIQNRHFTTSCQVATIIYEYNMRVNRYLNKWQEGCHSRNVSSLSSNCQSAWQFVGLFRLRVSKSLQLPSLVSCFISIKYNMKFVNLIFAYTHSTDKSPSLELIVAQSAKKFQNFHKTQRLITLFTKSAPLIPVLS
jgi:hypothetical protein